MSHKTFVSYVLKVYYNNACPDNFEELTSKAKTFLETREQLVEFRRDNSLKEKEIQFLRDENIKMMQLISQYEHRMEELAFQSTKEKSSTSILISELDSTSSAGKLATMESSGHEQSWIDYGGHSSDDKYGLGPVTMIKEVAEDSIEQNSNPDIG